MGGQDSGEKTKKQVSTSMIVFAAVVVGVGLGLLGLNHWHATRCAEAHSPEEIKGFMDTLTKRMLTAESQTYHNSLLMEKVISSLEQRLVIQEASELAKLQEHSQDEAVRVALQLASQPSPTTPEFPLDVKYLDAEILADAIDELLEHAGEEGDDDDKKDDFLLVKGGSGSSSGGGADQWGVGASGGSSGGSVGNPDAGLSDEEILKLCSEWKTKYSVVQGVSWGHLPFDLQGRWLKVKCDIYLTNTAPL
jgi:hypothetical protein